MKGGIGVLSFVLYLKIMTLGIQAVILFSLNLHMKMIKLEKLKDDSK
jgi:ABC-type nickel/cobalt efflux system permease component RcnA